MSDKEVKVKISATDNTKSTLEKIGANIQSTFAKATAAVGAFMAAFAIEKIASFFESAISKALEAEKAFKSTANALQDIGVNAGRLAPEVEKFLRQVSDSTGVNLVKVRETYNQLIRSTGSYEKANKGLLPTLDLMALRHLEGTQAALMYERSTLGNAKAALQFKNVTGAAAAENTGFVKTLNTVSNAYDELMVTLGEVLLGGDGVTKSGNKLVDMLHNLSTWITDHQKEIQNFRDGILGLAGDFATLSGWVIKAWSDINTWSDKMHNKMVPVLIGTGLGSIAGPMVNNAPNITKTPVTDEPTPHQTHNAADDAAAAMARRKEAAARAQEVSDLEGISKIQNLSKEQVHARTVLETELNKELSKGTLSMHDRILATEQLRKLDEVWRRENIRHTQSISITPSARGKADPAMKGPIDAHNIVTPFTEKDKQLVQDRINQAREEILTTNIHAIAIDGLSNAYTSMFEVIGNGHNVFRGLSEVMRSTIAGIARQYAQMEIAEAAKDFASAIGPIPNPAAAAAGAQHLAAAALFSLVAGAGSGGGGGGGYGGSSGITSNQYAQSRQDAIDKRGSATLVINGGLLDMSDPKQQDALSNAITQLTGMNILTVSGTH